MKKIFAFLGSTLLITGCFLPIISAPSRSFNFFDPIPVNIPDMPANVMLYAGISIIVIAVLSGILAFLNKTKLLWLAGVATTAILTSVYFGFHTKINEMKEQADKQIGDLFGGMFKGVTDSLFESIKLGGAGWYVVGSGAMLLLISSLIKRNYNVSIQK